MTDQPWTYRRIRYLDTAPEAFRELPHDPWDGWFNDGEMATKEAAAFFAQTVGEHFAIAWECPGQVEVEVRHPSGKAWTVDLKITLSVEVNPVWNGGVHEVRPPPIRYACENASEGEGHGQILSVEEDVSLKTLASATCTRCGGRLVRTLTEEE